MSSSKFFVQTDEYAFRELAKESTLPYFITDLAVDYYQEKEAEDRIAIPITDEDANVTYYICYWKCDHLKLEKIRICPEYESFADH